MGALRQANPVCRSMSFLCVTGDENDAMGVIALGQGYIQGAQCRQTRGDAVDHLHTNALGFEGLNLFATTAKNKRVPSLESDHLLARQGRLHHEFFNEGLRRRAASAAFTNINHTTTF